jgi:hypothetical protein
MMFDTHAAIAPPSGPGPTAQFDPVIQSASVLHATVHLPRAQMRPEAQSVLSAQAWNCVAAAAAPPLELLHAGAARATTPSSKKNNETARRPCSAGTASRLLKVMTMVSCV